MAHKKSTDQDFAAKMKMLRAASKVPMEELSRITGYDVEYLNDVESGDRRPPVSAIIRISDALKVDSGAFLSASSEPRKTKAESYSKRDKAYSYKTLSPDARQKHMKGFQVSIDPEKEHEGVAFSHVGEEFIYVIEGRLEITIGKKKESLKKGQSVHFDSSLVHKLRNPGRKKTELLVVVYTP